MKEIYSKDLKDSKAVQKISSELQGVTSVKELETLIAMFGESKIIVREAINQYKRLLKGISNKIKSQVPSSPDHNLFFSIFHGALIDLAPSDRCSTCHRASAVNYLSGPMVHLSTIGVDVEWVKRLFKSIELDSVLADFTNNTTTGTMK